MTQKSVIEIDVLDDKFKAFSKELDKVKKALSDQNKILKESATLRQMFSDKFQKSLQEIEKKIRSINPMIKDMVSNLANVRVIFSGIGLAVSGIVTGIEKVVKYLAVGALAGGAAMFGLASNASNVRRTAQGYGVTIGQLRAARGVYGTYLGDPEQIFGTLRNIQANPEEWGKLTALKISPYEDIGKDFPKILERAVEVYKASKGNAAYLAATGITSIFPLEFLRNLVAYSAQERSGMGLRYSQQEAMFGNKVGAYGQFQSLDELGKTLYQQFQDKLISKLTPLVKPLEELTKGLADMALDFLNAIGEYLKTPQFKTDIKQFSDNIKKFFGSLKDFLASPHFMEILGKFGSAISTFTDLIFWAASKLGFDTNKQYQYYDYSGYKSEWNPSQVQFALDQYKKHPFVVKDNPLAKQLAQDLGSQLSPAHKNLLWNMIGLESSWGVNMINDRGNIGFGQWDPKTAAYYKIDPFNYESSTKGMAKYLLDIENRFKLRGVKDNEELLNLALASYSGKEKIVNDLLTKYGSKWMEHLPKGQLDYIAKAKSAEFTGMTHPVNNQITVNVPANLDGSVQYKSPTLSTPTGVPYAGSFGTQ